MFVNPEYQGKGIGTSLLLEVEKYIKEKGLDGLIIGSLFQKDQKNKDE